MSGPRKTSDQLRLPLQRAVPAGAGDFVRSQCNEDAVRALARGGRLLAIGFASGRWPVIDIHDLVMTNTSIIGVIAGGLARRELDQIHAALEALVLDGRLRNAVTGQVAFDDLPAALQLMADGGVVGKRVVLP